MISADQGLRAPPQMRAPSGAQYLGAGFPSLSRELGAFLAWPALFTLGSRTLLWGGVSVAWLRSGCFPATRLERGFPENASSPGGSQGFPEPRAGGEPRVGLPQRGAPRACGKLSRRAQGARMDPALRGKTSKKCAGSGNHRLGIPAADSPPPTTQRLSRSDSMWGSQDLAVARRLWAGSSGDLAL